MIIKTSSMLWSMACMLMLWSDVLCAVSYHRQSIPTEAGESICSLSRNLKAVVPWTQEKISALRKTRDAYASKLLDWQLHFHGSSECGVNESILEDIRTELETVNKELQKLSAKAIRAGALAAKSAGRLDEFITVFANARKGSFIGTFNYCLGNKGDPARRRDLLDCFPEGEKLEIGEANLAKIPETAAHKEEPHLRAAINNVNHSACARYFNRIHGEDIHAGCNLINATSGFLGSALQDKLWWGGGILTIGKGFSGKMNRTTFIAGEATDAPGDNSKAFWTERPSEKIPHLQKTLAAFQVFKDATTKITQKFTEIEKIEKQIEPCLSNETMEEGPTQSCFKNAVNLNAELQAANALLARYHKEKGPLPSGSHRTHARCVFTFCYLIAFLL
ncbi:Transferrin receptor-like, ESAG6-like [Trypanosoma congolense IL3000]|uniref:Transferrin receptor-like, ESAG6-like n=1 Tax=Trypanosoma congolense (strain IL3000) TaxID=1068625 RepID=F9W6U5_TRYCI|nr:Transferrin receptor-like, ESAG6-like [Trypanosoma congolense IL3000]